MKQLGLSLLLTLIFTETPAQKVLSSRIGNLREGNVYLWNTVTHKIDSLEIRNHSFLYTAKLTEPALFYIVFEGFNDWSSPMRLVLSDSLTSMTFAELKPARQGSWKSLYPNKPDFDNDPNHNEQLLKFETAWKVFLTQ